MHFLYRYCKKYMPQNIIFRIFCLILRRMADFSCMMNTLDKILSLLQRARVYIFYYEIQFSLYNPRILWFVLLDRCTNSTNSAWNVATLCYAFLYVSGYFKTLQCSRPYELHVQIRSGWLLCFRFVTLHSSEYQRGMVNENGLLGSIVADSIIFLRVCIYVCIYIYRMLRNYRTFLWQIL